MSDTRDVQSMVSAAEAAAASGDYATAELRLRDAARLQEEQLGPLHPDLANTLNNLGIVNEILEKPAEAEASFRRAVAIATASLAPDHPFVLTSRKNLEDFCAARGIPIVLTAPVPMPDKPAAMPDKPPAVPEKPAAADQTPVPKPEAAPVRAPVPIAPVPIAPVPEPIPVPVSSPKASVPGPRQTPKAKRGSAPGPGSKPPPQPPAVPAAPAASGRTSVSPERTKASTPAASASASPPGSPNNDPPAGSHGRTALVIGALLIVALVVAIFSLRGCSGPDTGAATSGAMAQPPPPPGPAPPADPAPAPRGDPTASATAPSRESAPAPAAVAPTKDPANSPTPPPVPASRGRDSARPGTAPRIVDARLCRQLTTSGGWPCTALPDPAAAGRVFLYSRLTSPSNTSVQHRWYRGDQLVQSVDLSIRANANEGYRTYSRQTIAAGNWRVEIRAADGAVLHEQRFVVK